MIQNNLNRVSDIIPITQDQFDRWNSKKQYTLHKYVNVQKKTSNSNNKNIIQAKCRCRYSWLYIRCRIIYL